MVYKELKIVWQAARKARMGRDRDRNLEFLAFLASEGETHRMRQMALRQYIDLTQGQAIALHGAQARD